VDWPLIRQLALTAVFVVGGGAVVVNLLTPERQVPKGRTTDQRVNRGPHILQVKEISETEIVRVLVIPHPLGEIFDTTCVIYTHQDFKTATIICPDADRMNLRDSILDNELQRPLR